MKLQYKTKCLFCPLVAAVLVFGAFRGNVEAALIDFDALPATTLTGGTPPPEAVLTDDLGNLGIHFGLTGVSAGVAVIDNSNTFSLPNGINGLDVNGDITPNASGDTYFNFVLPNTNVQAVVNSVSWVMGDSGGDLDQWTVNAYDLSNVLIDTQNIQSTANIPVSINTPGINRVEILWTAPIVTGYLVDDIEFDTPTANVIPEPSTIAIWSLLGLVGLGYGWRKKRKAA